MVKISRIELNPWKSQNFHPLKLIHYTVWLIYSYYIWISSQLHIPIAVDRSLGELAATR